MESVVKVTQVSDRKKCLASHDNYDNVRSQD
jgi:hypothetical protein